MNAREEHAHSIEEAPYREGDAAAWDRPLRESELYAPERRDIFNFIDETKIRHLRPLLPASGNAIEIGAGSGRLLIRLGHERLTWRYGDLLRRLDGTPIADVLGFFYMVTARKPGR